MPEEKKDQPVTFSDEQQARVDEIVREAMGRAGKDHKDRAAKLEADVLAMKAELDAKKKAPSKKDGEATDVETLRAELEEIKRVGKTNESEVQRLNQLIADKDARIAAKDVETLNIRKESAMRTAAEKANFVSVEHALKIAGDEVRWDDETHAFVVIGPGGVIRKNAAYKNMTLEEYFNSVGRENPYMVRSQFRGGTGSTPSAGVSTDGKYALEDLFGKKMKPALTFKFKKENPAGYEAAKRDAIAAGLL